MSQPVLLSVKNLSKSYRRSRDRSLKAALKDVSFELYEGEMLGIVGESGSGKTTLTRLLTGLEKPNAGTMFFRGKDLNTLRKDIRIGLVFQDYNAAVNPTFTVLEAIAEPLYLHTKLTPSEREEKVLQWMDCVCLPHAYLHRSASLLSGGEKQRVSIARAMIESPDLLIFDEALSSLDRLTQHEIIGLIRALQTGNAFNALFISHDLEVTCSSCNRVLFLQNGEVEACLPVHEIPHSDNEYVRTLMDAVLTLDSTGDSCAHKA